MNKRRALEILTQANLPAPAIVPSELEPESWTIFSDNERIGHGRTVDEAMHSAYEYWGSVARMPRFTYEGFQVFRKGALVATTESKGMAIRIANALNLYNPDARGR